MNARTQTGINRIARWVLIFGFVLAALCAIAAVLSGVGYQMEAWHFRTGFQIIKWSFILAIGAVGLSLLGLLLSQKTRTNVMMGLLGIIIGGVMVYVPWSWKQTLDAHPYIHDITTDTDNPPQFIAVAAIRGPEDHPVAYDGEDVAALQHQAYPDLRPWVTSAAVDKVYAAAQAVVLRMGMKLVEANESDMRIEATDTTLFYGFSDDVVIRIAETPEGTKVDVRSKSRVGRSDLGQNAKRIREFLAGLKNEVGA